MKKLKLLLIPIFCLIPAVLFAQTSDQMQLIREAAKANKKLIVSTNLQLTEGEAKGFWSIYEEYQKALRELNERTGKVIKDYANNYNYLSDEKAKSILEDYITIEEDRIKLQKSYISRFNKVLPAKKVTRYYQIENKLSAIMKYDLARGIPLVK